MIDRRVFLGGSASILVGNGPFAFGPAPALAASATASVLPALPLPSATKLLGLGHHAIQIGNFAGGPNVACSINSYSPLIWSRFLDQRVNMDTFYDPNDPWGRTAGSIPTTSAGAGFNGANQGVEADILCPAPLPNVPATDTPGILARAPYALARNPGILFIHAGDNDIQGGRSAVAIIADLDSLLTQIRNAGVWTILSTLLPVWPGWTAAQSTIHGKVNTWILAQSGRDGVKVADMRAVWPNHQSLLARTINQTDQPYYDAPNYPAARRAADSVIAPLLAAMVRAPSVDILDPTLGNLIPNYAFAGATGSKGAGVSGQVATGWVLNRMRGQSVAVASLEAVGATGRNKQVVTVDAIDTDDRNQFFRFSFPTLNFSTIGVADGDWVQQVVPIEIDAWTGWTSISPKIDMQGGRRFIANHAVTMVYSGSTTWNAPVYVGAGAFVLASEPTQVLPSAGLTSFRTTEFMDIHFDGVRGGTGKLKIGNPILRKISDPRPAWNL